MMNMNESLMALIEDGIVDLEEAYSKSVDRQDMNDRVNNYLLRQVEKEELEPIEAVRRSFFRPDMLDMLRTHGYGRAVRNMDLSKADLTEEVVM
jgi:hypothetical protein